MNLGDGSPGSRLHDFESASLSAPGLSAQLLVTFTARFTYSCSWLQPLRGSAAPSPPSPPKFEPMWPAGSALEPLALTWNRFETPLSWRPPETTWPPLVL